MTLSFEQGGCGRAERDGGLLPAAGNRSRWAAAFTLMEVMIALGIFFMAVFSILALVSSTLRNARMLQETPVDAGMLASQISLTNRLTEGAESGDFGDLYPEYTYDQYTTQVTNGLWQVDFAVHRTHGNKPADTTMSIFIFSPNSQALPGGGLRPR